MTEKAGKAGELVKKLRQRLANVPRPVLMSAAVVAFALVGTILLVASHAATQSADFEAEAGTRSGGATVASDASASGGSAVKFGAGPAATMTLTVNGNTKYQTINSLGASINSDSWNNGELRPALDMLVDQNGTKNFRVVMEMMDWEGTNDDADANNYNWTYYDPIYSGATSFDTGQSGSNFANLWATIDYLHQKGIPDSQIILSFMGPGPSWLSGSKSNMAASKEDEFAELVTSAAYWGYSHGHTFGVFSPDNEADLTTNQEGIVMTSAVYAVSMNKIAARLDALGMSSVRLLGPETSGTNSSFVNAMEGYPALMAKVDHFDFHNYGGSTGNATSVIAGSGKDFWMSEFSIFDHASAC